MVQCGNSEVDEYDNSRIRRDEIWSEKVRCSSKMKPMLRAEWVSEELYILVSCFLNAMSRNSVLENRVESYVMFRIFIILDLQNCRL